MSVLWWQKLLYWNILQPQVDTRVLIQHSNLQCNGKNSLYGIQKQQWNDRLELCKTNSWWGERLHTELSLLVLRREGEQLACAVFAPYTVLTFHAFSQLLAFLTRQILFRLLIILYLWNKTGFVLCLFLQKHLFQLPESHFFWEVCDFIRVPQTVNNHEFIASKKCSYPLK